MKTKLKWLPTLVILDKDHPTDTTQSVEGRYLMRRKHRQSLNGVIAEDPVVLAQVYPSLIMENETVFRVNVFGFDDEHDLVLSFTINASTIEDACFSVEERLIPMLTNKTKHMIDLIADITARFVTTEGDKL